MTTAGILVFQTIFTRERKRLPLGAHLRANGRRFCLAVLGDLI